MNAEVYNPLNSDALERDIIKALGERQRKMELIAEWNKPRSRRFHLPAFAGIAAAACIALLLVFAPWRQNAITPSPLEQWMTASTEETRAAVVENTELTHALETKDYQKALQIVSVSITDYRQEEAQLTAQHSETPDEETEYELEVIRSQRDEVQWLRICLLVELEQNAEALDELDAYCKDPIMKAHKEEAQQLLQKLK